jgi:membrane protease YdiL (CAAX protease family)
MAFPFNLFPWLAGALTLAAGLACDTFLLARFTPLPPLRVEPKPWGMRELAQAAALICGVLLLSNSVYTGIAYWTHRDLESLAPLIIPAEAVLRIGILVGFLMFFKRRRIAIGDAVGRARFSAGLVWGVLFGLACLPPVSAVIFANDGVCRLLGIEPTDQPITELFTNTHSPVVLVSLTLFAMLIAPGFEEFVFRGFAYPVLKERFGPVRALIVISVAFAASHFHGPSFVPLFVLAMGLGLAYELTGTLLVPVTMHALFNTTMLVQLFYQRAHP